MNHHYAREWGLLAMMIALAPIPVLAGDEDQFCNDFIRESAPDNRWIQNLDGTTTDRATGLTWKHCVEGLTGDECQSGAVRRFTWQEALAHAEAANFADSSNWRLPNVTELLSLVEQRCTHPASNRWQWPNTPPLPLWSSTPDPDPESSPHSIWTVDFDLGAVRTEFGESTYPVRLVHGGW